MNYHNIEQSMLEDWALYYLRKTEQISVMLYEMPGRKPVHRYRWKGER